MSKTRKNDPGLIRSIIYVVAGFYVLGSVFVFFRGNAPADAPSSSNSLVVEYSATPPATPASAPKLAPVPPAPAVRRPAGSALPSAVVDGRTYSGKEQVEAMTQAAREAGLDEATARQAGRDAALLCSGNPECLR